MRSTVCFAFLLILAAGCGRGGPSAPPPPTPMAPPLSLYYDYGGGIRNTMREVIRDEATLASFWQQATSLQSPAPPVPDLNFDREMAILVAAGRMTPEDQIHVDSLLVRKELTPDNREVETLTIVVLTTRGCGRFRTDAFPLEIVRARRFDGPVKFEERTRQITCGEEPDGS